MPRVRLLLADDVGLGKTIEAGLILTELINQRRIRRVLIISPASIQIQWQEEMAEKFNLNFKIIDRETAFKIKKELGMDTNLWRTVPRIITSMDYIRQPNIFSQFKVASENLQPMGGASLPWDLIIVDGAHNFMDSLPFIASKKLVCFLAMRNSSKWAYFFITSICIQFPIS